MKIITEKKYENAVYIFNNAEFNEITQTAQIFVPVKCNSWTKKK